MITGGGGKPAAAGGRVKKGAANRLEETCRS